MRDILKPLANKVALVTGAASGIGEDIAKTYARAGACTILADLNHEKAQILEHSLINEGHKALAIKMDVGSEKEVKEGFDRIKKDLGRLDIVVCNAGIQHIEALESLSLANWQKVININLTGAFLLTHEALKIMYPQKGGAILYIGSVHSKEASKLKGPYVAAKHGVIGLSKVVAKEGAAYNVRSHVICPGFVRTPLVEKQIPEQAKALGISEKEVISNVMLKDTVDQEFTTLEEISSLALFLATQESKGLTGQSFIVSHGWCME